MIFRLHSDAPVKGNPCPALFILSECIQQECINRVHAHTVQTIFTFYSDCLDTLFSEPCAQERRLRAMQLYYLNTALPHNPPYHILTLINKNTHGCNKYREF